MLDETKEYKLYTCEICSELFESDEYLLRRRTFIDDSWSGLPRALEVIARKHLFEDMESGWPGVDRIRKVEDILANWSDPTVWKSIDVDIDVEEPKYNRPLDPELANLHCWAKNYIEALCDYLNDEIEKKMRRSSSQKARKKLEHTKLDKEEILDDWRSCDFRAALFATEREKRDRQWKNDRNKTSFERAIADALRMGPLRKRYLVGRAPDILKEIGKCREDEVEEGKKVRKMDKGHYNKVLGVTAMVLMQDGYNHDEGFVEFNPGRLCDWIGYNGDFPKRGALEWTYGGEHIFTSITIGSQSLWHLSRHWLDAGCWRIVDANDEEAIREAYEAIGPDCTFYGDDPGGFIEIPGKPGVRAELVDLRNVKVFLDLKGWWEKEMRKAGKPKRGACK